MKPGSPPSGCRIRVACPVCGLVSNRKASDILRGRAKHCSRACAVQDRPFTPITERLWRYARRGAPDECWHWQGPRSKDGYGYLSERVSRSVVKAHRVSWQFHYGAIPASLCVLHKCDAPSCVNPAHLFLGTQRDNIRDMENKGRRARGESFSTTRLTAAKVLAIRAARRDKSINTLAREYGVGRATISAVCARTTWAWL